MIPTDEQQAILAAVRTRNESLMISAYAGTGKTTTLEMIAHAAPLRPALALAFNVKAAKELQRRFPPHFSCKTFNSLGNSTLASLIGRHAEIDERKLGKLVTRVAREIATELSEAEWTTTRQLVTFAMNAGLVPSKFPKRGLIDDTPQNWATIAEDADLDPSAGILSLARKTLISSILQAFGIGWPKPIASYDDQIYLPTLLGAPFPRYDLVLVDEAQDLSPLQHLMVQKVASGRIIAVGDAKQAIYAFRGADSSSMEKLRALRANWINLPLTLTFRCPKHHVERAAQHAIGFRAHESNAEGKIVDLSCRWKWQDITAIAGAADIAVLCRNNAPLVALAMKLLAQSIPVTMLGRDIGKGLETLAKKLFPEKRMNALECNERIAEWLKTEQSLASANAKEHKLPGLSDRAECLTAILEHVNDAEGLLSALHNLFTQEHACVTLSSIHRAKGLEWSHVIHLNRRLIPSSFAKRAAKHGDTSALEQELNLRYVCETRAKETLILANLGDFE